MSTTFPTKMTFINIYLISNNQIQINLEEIWGFFKAFFGLCFYRCSIANAQDKQQCYPLVLAAVERLQGSTTRSMFKQLYRILRSFGGDKIEAIVNKHKESFSFCAVYHLDSDLEKLLWDFGNQSLKMAFVPEWTDLVIDNKKLWMMSSTTNCLSLSSQKSENVFGPIGHYISSVHTGIPLLCHMGHHGKSTTEIIKANL